MNKNICYAAFVAVFAATALLFVSCGTTSKIGNEAYDNFRADRPLSILVLPPLNNSVEVDAPGVIHSSTIFPLSEAGYYVVPIAVTQQMFRQNGIQTAADAHAVSPKRLREIFGADAALYMTITKFGANFQVIRSIVEVEVSVTLMDLRSGNELWKGKIIHQEEPSKTTVKGAGILGVLAGAVVDQVSNTLSNSSYSVGRNAMSILLNADDPKGVLYGPYNPKYESD